MGGVKNFARFFSKCNWTINVQNLGAYGEDLDGLTKAIREHDPLFDPKGVVEQNKPTAAGACPPYFIYVDHGRREVNMYIRGLNLMHRYDYETLLNNRKGEKVRQSERLLSWLSMEEVT